ncbi:MAG: hypothetical protein ACLVJH_02815 [Faecalibacterium prausnitzii]
MNVNYKMMGVVSLRCDASGIGMRGKSRNDRFSAVESESVSVVALEAALSEAVPESEAVSEAVSKLLLR